MRNLSDRDDNELRELLAVRALACLESLVSGQAEGCQPDNEEMAAMIRVLTGYIQDTFAPCRSKGFKPTVVD